MREQLIHTGVCPQVLTQAPDETLGKSWGGGAAGASLILLRQLWVGSWGDCHRRDQAKIRILGILSPALLFSSAKRAQNGVNDHPGLCGEASKKSQRCRVQSFQVGKETHMLGG